MRGRGGREGPLVLGSQEVMNRWVGGERRRMVAVVRAVGGGEERPTRLFRLATCSLDRERSVW